MNVFPLFVHTIRSEKVKGKGKQQRKGMVIVPYNTPMVFDEGVNTRRENEVSTSRGNIHGSRITQVFVTIYQVINKILCFNPTLWHKTF